MIRKKNVEMANMIIDMAVSQPLIVNQYICGLLKESTGLGAGYLHSAISYPP